MKRFSQERPPIGTEIRVFRGGDPEHINFGKIPGDNQTVLELHNGFTLKLRPTDCWDYPQPNLQRPRRAELANNVPVESKRYNEGKPKLSYFARSFPKAMECVARVKELGAVKYDDGNWRLGNKPDAEYLDSHERHMLAFMHGQFYDEDSGCAHLGHAIWNLCALFELNYGTSPVIDQKVFSERIQYWSQKRVDSGQNVGNTISVDGTQRCCPSQFTGPSSRGIDNEFCLGPASGIEPEDESSSGEYNSHWNDSDSDYSGL